MTKTNELAENAFAGVKPVEERHRFDEARLSAWMSGHVEGFEGPLRVEQFRGGQSNPTFKLSTPKQNYVLRRKPMGKLLPSAHAVDREYRVITALRQVDFPVARSYGLCLDDGVIGSAFYIMDMVEGRVFWNGVLPELAPAERGQVYEAAILTLARLHQIDPQAIGLGDYGKPGNYFMRQIERWSRQYRASETKVIVEMDRLIEFLPRTAPAQERSSIVHGDYRLDNMIFDAKEPRIRAVLDWELSTLGDPLADFSYLLMNWVMPRDGRSGLAGADFAALGVPTIEAAVSLYCAHTGRDAIPALDWYFAYNLFRLAAIVQGIAKRVEEGTAASDKAREMGERAAPLAAAAWSFARKAGA